MTAKEMRLDDVCNVEYGTRVVQKRDGGNIYPVYGGGGATFKMDWFNREDRLVVSRFGMSEECTRFVSGKFFLNDSGLTVSPKNGLLQTRFLDYQLSAKNDEIFGLGKGSAQKNLDVSAFRELPLFIPASVEEQHRIVAILDEAFAGIATAKANAEKNLRNAGEVFDKTLTQIFSDHRSGWKVKRLDEVCAITSALIDPRQPKYINAIHVGAGNIESKTGKLLDLKTSREEGLISGKFPFDEAMVLYSKIRPYLEKVVRPDFSGICSADMYPLAPIKGQITRNFLYWLLLSKPFTDYAIKGSARVGMPKVNREHLFQYEAELPEVEEQDRIVVKLDTLRNEVSQLQSLYTRKLAALDELKKSLLHRAFAGEL